MSRRPVPILYEDDRGEVREFGLHALIVACVADVWGSEHWQLRGHFTAIPKKGDSKLLAACRDDVPLMPNAVIFAIFDADKLHRLLFDSGRPSNDELLARLRERCPDARLELMLLSENTETVVDAVADSLGEERPGKDKLLRDRLLNRAAHGSRSVRDQVREAVASFDVIVTTIAERARPHVDR